MNKTILSLIPQSTESILKNQLAKIKVLELVKFFLTEIIATIDNFFISGIFSSFDPHVGDTLCQIRAYQFIVFNKKDLQLFNVKSELDKYLYQLSLTKECLSMFEKLIDNKRGIYNKILDKQEKIDDFLKKHQLFFEIPSDLLFLLQGYLLTKFSVKGEYGISFSINYKKLSCDLQVSNTISRKITRRFQQNLAWLSCNFIHNIIVDLPGFNELRSILKYLQRKDNHKRDVLPCYESTCVLLEHMQKNNILILIIAHRIFEGANDLLKLLFVPEGEDYKLQLNFPERRLKEPCVIIKGVSICEYKDYFESRDSFLQRFNKVGLKNIILANMAKHPQYSASEFNSISDNPYQSFIAERNAQIYVLESQGNCDIQLLKKLKEQVKLAKELEKKLIRMKLVAEKEGCCIENSNLFFVKHIFCDTLENQLNIDNYIQYENCAPLYKNDKRVIELEMI